MGMGGGGRGRSRTQRKHFHQSRDNVWKRSSSSSSTSVSSDPHHQQEGQSNPAWEPFATQNPSFDDYYKEQGIVSPEEWGTFIEYLRKPLPAAFRINSCSQFCAVIRSQLENDFMISLQAEGTEGNEVDAIRPLPWYPDNLAWQSNFSRMQLRKNQNLARFHEFLKVENEIGNITRQEAVSMVPPLFLDVRPDHFVLDMCAAPGSKTFQLLEMIHRSTETGSLPSGMVIANDVDVQRCNLLIHQTKRICTANLIVTNHEAQHFPSCRLKNYANAFEMGVEVSGLCQLLFDRVLCDVPCSGDGTLRKAPDIWRKWNSGMGNGLHSLQVLIAMRGLSLLKVGGRMVYSTCSMNPVENEAVVAEVLRRCRGSVEIVDVSSELPQLVRRPGLKKWKIRDKGLSLASYKDVPKSRRDGIIPSMFPSGNTYVDSIHNDNTTATTEMCDNKENPINGNNLAEDPGAQINDDLEEEFSTLPLERCMRIVPHDQNTGAFFIAVFHKLSPLPAIEKKSVRQHGQSSPVNGFQVNNDTTLEDVTDEKFPEPSSLADSLEIETEEAALNTDPSNLSEESGPERIKASVDTETVPVSIQGKRKLQIQGKWRGVDPVVFFRDDAAVSKTKAFYGIDESFPFIGHLVTRNSDTNHVKRIYYISKSVKDVLELNLQGGQQLKITSIGIKMFERQSSKEGSLSRCAFRISSEGLPLIFPHLTKQILCASPVDFKHLLQYKSIKFAGFVEAEFGEKASKLMLGCCVVVLNKGDRPLSDPSQFDASTIAIGCWRGRTNVAVMVTALECQELLERLLEHMEIEKGSLLDVDELSSLKPDEVTKLKVNEIKEETETQTLTMVG